MSWTGKYGGTKETDKPREANIFRASAKATTLIPNTGLFPPPLYDASTLKRLNTLAFCYLLMCL